MYALLADLAAALLSHSAPSVSKLCTFAKAQVNRPLAVRPRGCTFRHISHNVGGTELWRKCASRGAQRAHALEISCEKSE